MRVACRVCGKRFRNLFNHVNQSERCRTSTAQQTVVDANDDDDHLLPPMEEIRIYPPQHQHPDDDYDNSTSTTARRDTRRRLLRSRKEESNGRQGRNDDEAGSWYSFDEDDSPMFANRDNDGEEDESWTTGGSDKRTANGGSFEFPTRQYLKDSEKERFFSPEERFLGRLLELLDFSNVPLYLCDAIIKIVQESATEGLDFAGRPVMSRKAFLRIMRQRFEYTPVPRAVVVGMEAASESSTTNHCSPAQKNPSSTVICYRFADQMCDLLADKEVFGCEENFIGTVDLDGNRFSCQPPPTEDGKVDEIVSALWYRKTYHAISRHHNEEMPFFVMPIVMYIDKTGTDSYQRYGLEPVLFTTAVLNRNARNHPKSWRPLGYIPDLHKTSAACKDADRTTIKGKGRPTRNYHTCLRKILQSFVDNQGISTRVYGDVRIGNQVKYCRLYFPLAFIIGDALSGDRLCGRYCGYNDVFRISRSCWTSFDDADDPHVVCESVASKDFEDNSNTFLRYCKIIVDDRIRPSYADYMHAKDSLHRSSHHPHISAFENVWFGENHSGIAGATPHDLMHIFLLGVVKQSIKVFLDIFTPSEKAELDRMIDVAHVSHRSSEQNSFPRCTFRKGITNLTLLTADEWMGVVFSLALTAMSHGGMMLMTRVHQRKYPDAYTSDDGSQQPPKHHSKKKKTPPPTTQGPAVTNTTIREEHAVCNPILFLEMCEMFLCFHAWYKGHGSYPLLSEDGFSECTTRAIRHLLSQMKLRLPRTKNNCWKLQKFHELLHVPRDMRSWGCPANYDASPGEHMLIYFAKKVSRNAQRRNDTFLQNVNARLWEKDLLRKVVRSLPNTIKFKHRYHSSTGKSGSSNTSYAEEDGDDEEEKVSSTLVGKHKYTIIAIVHENNGIRTIDCKWHGDRDSVLGHRDVHPIVMRWFLDELMASSKEGIFDPQTDRIDCWTEYIRDGRLFRAHPNYASEGPWYDWVMVQFDDVDHENVNRSSKQNLQRNRKQREGYFGTRFFPSKILCFFCVPGSDEIHALVHPCNKSNHKHDSVIMERWQLDYRAEKKRSFHSTQKSDQLRRYVPALCVVPVNSFGERILVREDDPRIQESLTSSCSSPQHFPWVTLVLPREAHWADQFL